MSIINEIEIFQKRDPEENILENGAGLDKVYI